MKIFVTGAAGFLGAPVVSIAIERGHIVRALTRASRSVPPQAGVDWVVGDLLRTETWQDALAGVDAVIHLAARKGGDVYQQLPGTVVATERLLEEMRRVGVRRLVHVSTFSVYDYERLAPGSQLTEESALVGEPRRYDGYTQTKLLQERLVRDAAAEGLEVTIVRPGAVWGRGEFWDGGYGQVVGPLWVAAGDGVTRKFTYVENCAEAIVLAAERVGAINATVNIVDGRPAQDQYVRMLREHGVSLPRALPMPFGPLRALVRSLAHINLLLFHGRARLPSILRPASLDARFKPLTYPNSFARELLDWEPRYDLAEAMKRATAPEG